MCMEQCCSWLLPMLEILGKQSLGGISIPLPKLFGDILWAWLGKVL